MNVNGTLTSILILYRQTNEVLNTDARGLGGDRLTGESS